MEWQAYYTLIVLTTVLGLLSMTRIGADLIMMAALTALLTPGIIGPGDAFVGFANEGVITIAALFVVAAGLRETGAISLLTSPVLGKPKSITRAQARVMTSTACISAFISNTPVVALMMPALNDWGKRNQVSPSQLMIPLSYASILGGMCTLIGTSTNVVVNGLLISRRDLPVMGLFEIAWVGLPCAIAGIAYILICSRWLLPDRKSAVSELSDPRQYTVEMLVEPGSPLVGKTIEDAQLRHLPGLFLTEIDRDGKVLPAVGPTEQLRGNDRLIFVGIVESVVDLQRIRGLRPATDQVFKLDSPRSLRCLIEAVVSDSCPLVGKTIREGRFRTNYNAAIIAVGRGGERLEQKVGDIVLQSGDTLLLETHQGFAAQQRNSRDFYLVSRVEGSTPLRHERAWLSLSILLAMVLATSLGFLSLLNASLLAAGLMVLARCCSGTDARRSIDFRVLLTIAGSFAIGEAMQASGAADAIARTLFGLAVTPWLALLLTYGLTMVLTEVVSNNATAVLLFPIALTTAATFGVSAMPFVVAIMIAASTGFATPIGYQTNLMVAGPGGYRSSDFLRLGLPLKLLVAAIALPIIPVIWPF